MQTQATVYGAYANGFVLPVQGNQLAFLDGVVCFGGGPFVGARGVTGLPGSSVPNFVEGQSGLDLVDATLLGKKALVVDIISGGYVSLDDTATPTMSQIEQVAGVTITNDTTGTTISKRGKIVSSPPNALRYNYNATGRQIGALFEGPSTNLILSSEDISSTAWSKSGVAVAVNNKISPDGNLTADLVYEGVSNGVHYIVQPSLVFTAGQPLTASGFVKSEGRSKFTILIVDTATNVIGGSFNFDLNAKTAASQNAGTGTAGVSSIVEFPDKWFRFEATATIGGTFTFAAFFLLVADEAGNLSYAGSGGNGLNLWGLQLEQQPYATGYMKTTGSQVTRAGDVLKFPVSGYTMEQLTVFGEFTPNGFPSLNYIMQVFASAGNRFFIQTFGSALSAVYFDGTTQNTIASIGAVPGTTYRFAGAIDWAKKKIRMKLQGVAAPTEVSFSQVIGTVPVSFSVGSYDGTAVWANANISLAGIVDRAWTADEIAKWVG